MRLNLYISEKDEPTIRSWKTMLQQEGKNVSGFVVEAAQRYLNANAEPADIELGKHPKRIFKGRELYSDGSLQGIGTRVYLTAKGNIVFWQGSSEGSEDFRVYGNLSELWIQQGWLKLHKNKHIKDRIQAAYAALTSTTAVERLDI